MHVRPASVWTLLSVGLLLTFPGLAPGASPVRLAREGPPSSGTAMAIDTPESHPLVLIVQEYRRAVAQRDTAAMRRLQAPRAGIWFEKKEGDGRRLDAGGKGPWADWDRFFHSRAEALEYVVDGRSVRVTNREINDWYRLLEREPAPYYIFYFLDTDGRIEGKLIQGIPGIESPPDRLDEFKTWAAKKDPGLLEELLPKGRIDPALEKARVWKEKLIEWRLESGLPAVRFDEH